MTQLREQPSLQKYQNRNRSSGVTAFTLGRDWIIVEFKGGSAYLYNYESAGQFAIERMKELAAAGKGLSTFISRSGPPYEKKVW